MFLKKSDKSSKSKLDKVLLGFVIGSAVAGVVGAGLKTEKGKQIKEDVTKKLQSTSGKIKGILDVKKKDEKKSIWFFLHNVFFGKKKK